MSEIKLKIKGPFGLVGNKSIFNVPENKLSGLYFFTIEYKKDYIIEYVGITTKRNYNIRFFEHVREYLSGGYQLHDVRKLLNGKLSVVWNGRFGKNKENITKFLNNYEKFTPIIFKQLKAYKIFLIPIKNHRIAERIEGAIYDILKNSTDKQVKNFIAEGIRYKVRNKSEKPIIVNIESEVLLLGLPNSFEV